VICYAVLSGGGANSCDEIICTFFEDTNQCANPGH
jgi:hypothetical protein